MFFRLPFYNPQITIKDLINSFFLKNPQEKLASHLQDYFNSENILLLKSARQGIKFILENLNLTPEDEVITPSFICEVVPEAVIKAGGKPVFCDVEKNGLNMDIEIVRSLISPRTRAIILSYICGIPAPIDEFVKLSKENNLILIEDCAHAFGARYQERLLGTFGDFAVFSFGISKNIGGLGGGFLHSRNREHFERVRKIASGTKRPHFSFKKHLEFYLIPLVFNKYFYWLFSNFVEKYAIIRREKENDKEFLSSLSNLEAKIVLQKLGRYEKKMQGKNENALIYKQELKDFFSFLEIPTRSQPAYPYFPVFATPETFNILSRHNIPLRRLDFGNLDEGAFNERELQKKYFLLPLNYSSNETRKITQRIKEILSHAKQEDY